MTIIATTGTRRLREIWDKAEIYGNPKARRRYGIKKWRFAQLGKEECERRYQEAIEINERHGINPRAERLKRPKRRRPIRYSNKPVTLATKVTDV